MGELFSGPGGMALGAHHAANQLDRISLNHSWANDYDSDTCKTYIANIPGASNSSVFCADVKEFDIASMSGIDGLAFGFPCNDFSTVGKWQGLEGKFGPLYTYGVKALDIHNPMWFVAENVSGLQAANDGEAFNTILTELASAGAFGYKLYPHLYSFDQYGVAQKRRRIIIVGIRADLDVEFRVPSPQIYAGTNVSVSHVLSNPPLGTDAANNEITKQHPRVVDRLQHIQPGQNAFTAELPEHLRLNIKGATISQIYKRLHPDEPSYTITGSGGGGTHVYHWAEPRALTNRERARLQSFPDDFIFIGNRGSVRKQVGMAVPAKGAEAIFTALFKSFLDEKYDSVPNNISIKANLTLV